MNVCVCAHLIELSPGNHHVAEVIGEVWFVKYLLGQEVLIVVVEVVMRLDLRGEFTVESAAHELPGHTLRHHKWHSVLTTSTEES